MSLALIGIGSNLGERAALLDEAIRLLGQTAGIQVRAVSRWHETLPIGGPAAQGPFLNGAVKLETSLAPKALFSALTEIEDRLGRERHARWQARTLDLDLLIYDELQLSQPGLTIPHPRLAFRRFVVEPAAEIAPEMIHPAVGWSLARLRDHLRTARPYLAIAGPAGSGKTHLADELVDFFSAHRIAAPRLPAGELGAGSAGRALAWELELLVERGARLTAHDWPHDAPLAVSDFWFDQSLAYGGLRLDPPALGELKARHESLSHSVVPPKLVVLLTHNPAQRPADDSFALALRQLIGSGSGPFLELPADDWERQWDEVVAAVAAMA
ncbi:MAG TPA: 2-amino-4-hydroxy-6-hydroxymethyldihydropteridine diphosphokinase [Pirellulales bacterium]|nr:2-amino-4-hydroxy-6-hydroxymethyldihydropteridine diphosphokinase [Pirellulales bacterium]